jgi:hypothetical protein
VDPWGGTPAIAMRHYPLEGMTLQLQCMRCMRNSCALHHKLTVIKPQMNGNASDAIVIHNRLFDFSKMGDTIMWRDGDVEPTHSGIHLPENASQFRCWKGRALAPTAAASQVRYDPHMCRRTVPKGKQPLWSNMREMDKIFFWVDLMNN